MTTSILQNPLASPLFLPTLYVAAGVLCATLMALLLVVRFNLSRLRESVLFQRWRVWVTIAPLFGLAVLGGTLPLVLLVSFLVFQGLREYATLVRLPGSYEKVLLVAGLVTAPVGALSMEAFYLLPPLLLIAGTLQPLLFQQRENVRHLAFAALGWGYLAWMLSHLVLIHSYVEGGAGILLALGLGTALSDVGAFTIGKLFGRHKLAPRLSPNKTWEGVVGNVLGAYAGVSLMAFALPGHDMPLRTQLLIALPLVIAAGSLWGDLLESSIKREFAAKDAGAWLPGFGGLLDRVDSLIIVVPLALYALMLIESLPHGS